MKVKNSLDEILYEHIVESLINGDYEMGQNLTLDELAHRFEVSRTPVVQAVKLLANDGILQIMGNGRIYVPEYDRVQGRFLVSNYLLCPLRLRDFSGTARDHVRLVESIRSGDITRAQHCLQQHIEGVLRRL